MVIAVIAVLVFGARLPQVAGEAAATVQKLRRALTDLRRDSGIDDELRNARREVDRQLLEPLRQADIAGTVKREAQSARTGLEKAITQAGEAPPKQQGAENDREESAAERDPKGEPDGTTPPRPQERSDPRPD